MGKEGNAEKVVRDIRRRTRRRFSAEEKAHRLLRVRHRQARARSPRYAGKRNGQLS